MKTLIVLLALCAAAPLAYAQAPEASQAPQGARYGALGASFADARREVGAMRADMNRITNQCVQTGHCDGTQYDQFLDNLSIIQEK